MGRVPEARRPERAVAVERQHINERSVAVAGPRRTETGRPRHGINLGAVTEMRREIADPEPEPRPSRHRRDHEASQTEQPQNDRRHQRSRRPGRRNHGRDNGPNAKRCEPRPRPRKHDRDQQHGRSHRRWHHRRHRPHQCPQCSHDGQRPGWIGLLCPRTNAGTDQRQRRCEPETGVAGIVIAVDEGRRQVVAIVGNRVRILGREQHVPGIADEIRKPIQGIPDARQQHRPDDDGGRLGHACETIGNNEHQRSSCQSQGRPKRDFRIDRYRRQPPRRDHVCFRRQLPDRMLDRPRHYRCGLDQRPHQNNRDQRTRHTDIKWQRAFRPRARSAAVPQCKQTNHHSSCGPRQRRRATIP